MPPSKAAAYGSVKTQPKEGGPNPNINSIVDFKVELPSEELYCPTLTC